MKIKLPTIFSMKRKKLRAAVARKPLRIAATAEYDEMAEPNMKLSRALLIVLVLHVVAVSGIIAFNAIKTRQSSAPQPVVAAHSSPASAAAAGKSPTASRHEEAMSPSAASRQAGKDQRASDRGKGSATRPADSGKVYVVAKGDNPVTIAKKLKVSYDDLLALNHIEDPHKLQIGQKLLIPAKATKPKKNNE